MQEKYRFFLVSLQRYTYLCILFLLPTQLGKHFWPPYAFVGGLRIDYLSPTLFFTDVLILLLFILFVFHFKVQSSKFKVSKKSIFFALLFSAFILGGIFFSKNPQAGILGAIKLLEMGFFGWYTARFLGKSISLITAFYAIALSVLFQAGLAIAQFWVKGSVGGVLYFFGERSFSMLTPGIANASIQGSLLLRPYGTLPHPNVLAGFLLIGMLFVLGVWYIYKTRVMTVVAGVTLVLGSVALLVSLSRIPILFFGMVILLLGGYAMKQKVHQRYLLALLVLCAFVGIGLLFTPLFGRFASSSFFEEAFLVRKDLALNAMWMIQTHPLLGVGLQNFLPNLPQGLSSFSYFTRIQPVHNIYLLLFAEVGIFAGSIVLFLFWKTFRHALSSPRSFWQTTVLLMFVTVLVLGLFDHYFLTIQQGRLLLAFVIGCCWSLQGARVKRKG